MSQSTIRPGLTTTILFLSLCCIGCEDTGDTNRNGLQSEPWDSAGVTIVENERPAPDSRLPWEIGAEPSLSIGAVDSEEADQLFQVTDAMRLPDGRIVIANSGSNELRVFNADGSHSATWGGRGEGPGEFISYSPTAVAAWPGDSVAAPNPWGTRLTLFDSDGNHGRDVRLDPTMLNVVDVLPDGKIVSEGSGLRGDTKGSSGLVRSPAEWAILDSDGTRHASLGEYPGAEWLAIFDSDGNLEGGRPHPFGRATVGAVWGELVAIGVQDSYEIKAYRTDGSLARIVRRAGDLESPTRADLEAYFARRYANRPDDERISALAEVKDMPLVESFPAFSVILSDLAGNLWVQEYQMPGEEAVVWTVFDPGGRIRGLIETPADLEVFKIGEDYILGRVRDELGVEYVQLWSLSRGAG